MMKHKNANKRLLGITIFLLFLAIVSISKSSDMFVKEIKLSYFEKYEAAVSQIEKMKSVAYDHLIPGFASIAKKDFDDVLKNKRSLDYSLMRYLLRIRVPGIETALSPESILADTDLKALHQSKLLEIYYAYNNVNCNIDEIQSILYKNLRTSIDQTLAKLFEGTTHLSEENKAEMRKRYEETLHMKELGIKQEIETHLKGISYHVDRVSTFKDILKRKQLESNYAYYFYSVYDDYGLAMAVSIQTGKINIRLKQKLKEKGFNDGTEEYKNLFTQFSLETFSFPENTKRNKDLLELFEKRELLDPGEIVFRDTPKARGRSQLRER